MSSMPKILDNQTIIKSVECSVLGNVLLKPIIKIIINFIKSSSYWLEGIWISNKSSTFGAIIISNSVGWFSILKSDQLTTKYVFYSIQYSKSDEYTITAKWKKLNDTATHGTAIITASKSSTFQTEIDSINITLNVLNSKNVSIKSQLKGTAKKMITLKDEIDKYLSNEVEIEGEDYEHKMQEWIEVYKANKCLLECTAYNKSKHLFDNNLNIPIFGYGTLGDRDCDGNNSNWNKTLIHGCKGKNAYINEWKLYQHPSHHYPFTDNKGNCKGYKLIGRILEWNDVYINAFKIYQIDQICQYNRCNEKMSFFKRKIVVCNVVNEDGSEYEMKCWLWFVGKHSVHQLEKHFDCIESGDWKDRKYSKYES
eukprot:333168_1